MYTITNVHLYPLPVNKKSGAFFPLFYTFSRSLCIQALRSAFLCRYFNKARVLKQHIFFDSVIRKTVMQIVGSYSVTAPDPRLCASSQAVIWTACWNSPFVISSSISRAEYFLTSRNSMSSRVCPETRRQFFAVNRKA